jgi:hypothetical protein
MAEQDQARELEEQKYREALTKFPSVKTLVNGEEILLKVDGTPLDRLTPHYDRMHRELPLFKLKLPAAPNPLLGRQLFKQGDAVPVPENLKENMDSKTMTSTFRDCMKSNPPPLIDAKSTAWHDFLSEFHAQWTAQKWPNTEASAMCLQAELGSNEKLQWTRGDNLQAYLEALSFNMGTQGSLRKRNGMMSNYVIDKDTRLSAHWGIFRRRAAEELSITVPLTGTEEVRALFVQRIQGSPHERAWANMLMYHQFEQGLTEANWKQAITIAQSNHAAPQSPTPTPVNKLDPRGAEYRSATEKANQPRKNACMACNDTTHDDASCPLIDKFRECYPRKFIPFSRHTEKKCFCPVHGHQNSHDGPDCYTMGKMRENPSGSRAQLMDRTRQREKDRDSGRDRTEKDKKRRRDPRPVGANAAIVPPRKKRKEDDYADCSDDDGGSDSDGYQSFKRIQQERKRVKASLNGQGSRK